MGQPLPGQVPMGQFAGLLALVGFLYLGYTTLITILAGASGGMGHLVRSTSFVLFAGATTYYLGSGCGWSLRCSWSA